MYEILLDIGKRLIADSVFSLYLAVDTSASMSREDGLAAVEEALFRLAEELAIHPLLGELVRVAVITFSDRAELVLPLSDLTEIRAIPRMRAVSGGTNYGAAFRLLATVVSHDLRVLRSQDVMTFRPVICFITDGAPTDSGWERSHRELIDRVGPEILAIGLDDASQEILAHVATREVLHLQGGAEDQMGERLVDYLLSYTRSLVTSRIITTPRRPFEIPDF